MRMQVIIIITSNYYPITFFHKWQKSCRDNGFVRKSSSYSAVSIFSITVSPLSTCARKWWCFMATCLVRGLFFGVFTISKEPFFSSKTAHFIVLTQSFMFIAGMISLSKCTRGIPSRNAYESETCFASAVDKAIYDCSFDFYVMGKPACFIANPFLEYTDLGSSAHDLSNPPAK